MKKVMRSLLSKKLEIILTLKNRQKDYERVLWVMFRQVAGISLA